MKTTDLQHNIVSILYTIKGMTESHLEQAECGRFQEMSERLHHAEEIIKKTCLQSEKALAVLKQIRLILKTEGSVGERRKVTISRSWKMAVRLLSQQFDLRNVEIIERIPERFPAILCDRNQLTKIFYHLGKDSLQAMRKEEDKPIGKLILRAEMGFSQKEEYLAMISLADTGCGIPEEHLAYLFRPFFTTKSSEEGNGLGLYLTRALVSKNQGTLSVSSFQDHGTTYQLTFPIASQKLTQSRKTSP